MDKVLIFRMGLRVIPANFPIPAIDGVGVIHNAFLLEIQKLPDSQGQAVGKNDLALHGGGERADAIQLQRGRSDVLRIAFLNAVNQRFIIGTRRERHITPQLILRVRAGQFRLRLISAWFSTGELVPARATAATLHGLI